MTNLIPTPSVSLVNGQPATTSIAIAEHFGKAHDRVLKDIRRIAAETPADFNAVNFAAVDYVDAKGETRPMFTVFFDGFILLAMGYTGKQALQIKLVYIAAFNAMREQLAQRDIKPHPALDTDTRLSTPADEERKALNKLVKVWGNMLGGDARVWPVINTQVAAYIGVTTVDHMIVAQVREAIKFVQSKIDVLQNSQLSALPAPEQPALPAHPDDDELERLFLSMVRLVKEFRALDQDMHAILDRAARRQMRRFDARRSFALANLHAAESMGNSLGHMLDAMKHHAQAVLRAELM